MMKRRIEILNFIDKETKQHNPTLKTFVLIERLMLKKKKFERKQDMYDLLPRGIRYHTFNFVLRVLELEGRIAFRNNGSFSWIQNATNKTHLKILNFMEKQTKQHNPTMRTFVRVEKLILKRKKFKRKQEMYSALPKGVRYPTFNFILQLLEKREDVVFNNDGSFAWIGKTDKRSRKSTKKTKRR